jgi:NAD-dependent oxidoreductase involved in siderophore biosynthesis
MDKNNLRATVIGDRLGRLVDCLQMNSWSTNHVSTEQIRKLEPKKTQVFQPLVWADILVIEADLWKDGIRAKIESVVRAPIVLAAFENGEFDFQNIWQKMMQKTKIS